MTMREKIAQAARKFHRESCYPDALDFEVDAFIDAVLDALSHPTPEMEKALCAVMSDGGLYFHHPDDGDLDDYERHCFKTLRAAFVAAIRKAGEK
ncbi:hypothetical protein LG047_15635 [Methylocystis sp. WRRC1]|uniref:hypothetical protein n=1 Tax=Methylocystis sp. WRRC1 TaxID=1732014 RepID=UPI001D14E796|nr:hypothetical protein [Methylocystis sp. WRRC1]MCC3246732.1 hypothetical protein [Methylocystis sp. WRRC1]